MRGDILDTKRVLSQYLSGQVFLDVLAAVITEKQAAQGSGEDPIPNPVALRVPTVYMEERLSKQLFPLCELLAYNTTYSNPDDVVKMATHKIGMRWTALSDDEGVVTQMVELLCTATVELLWNPLYGGYLTDASLNAGSVIIVEEDYSPLLPNPQGAFLKSGLVIADITTYRS